MKNLPIALIALISMLLFTTCEKQENYLPEVTPAETIDLEALARQLPVNAEALALEILDRTEWPQAVSTPQEKAWVRPGKLLSYEKTYITDDIVHYAFVLAGGSGEYDKIGLHRVVKVDAEGAPVHTFDNFFYQHGDAKDFTGMMLPGQLSPNTADDFGLAVYLAENGVDVWGIDQAWTLVPAEVTDHGFMKDWGIDRQVRDLRIAMAVAAFLRYRTGFGVGKYILAGYSSGVATGYATVNFEAPLPKLARLVKGFIPIDLTVISDDPVFKSVFMGEYERLSELIGGGAFGDFVPFQLVSELARIDPDGDSPIFPGLTNMQGALFFGAGNILGESAFHYLAGVWESGLPVDLRYLSTDQWLDFLAAAVPWEAAKFMQDYSIWISETEEVPWDDNFAEITVPILSVDPAGGSDRLSEYTDQFLGSKDITHLNIQLLPEGEELYDFAHIDIFIANNAEELVWQPMLEWIKDHR